MSQSSEGIAGKILVGIVVTVFGAGIVYYLGWNDVRSKSRTIPEGANSAAKTGDPADVVYNTMTRDLTVKTPVPAGRSYAVKVWTGKGFTGTGDMIVWIPTSGKIILPADVTPDTEVSVHHQVEGDNNTIVLVLDKKKLKDIPRP